jgi:uncharacterized membrane protein HdeD (DUF308 family)
MLVVDELARHWWLIALRGLAAIIFGILAFAWPGLTLAILVILFGAYAIVDGVLGIIAAFRGDAHHRVVLGIEGVVSVLAGIAAFVWPLITAFVLLYIIAIWAIITGIIEIIASVRLRRALSNEIGLIVGGVLSVVFGIVLIVAPGAGAVAVVFLIGAYAIIFGVSLLGLAWRLRQHHAHLTGGASLGAATPA